MLTKLIHILRRDGLWYTTKRALAFSIAHTPFGNHLSFSYHRGTRLIFAPALLTYQIFANHLTRCDDVAVFTTFLHTGDVAIDVGANIGSLTIPAAQHVGPSGTVIAIEPSPKFAAIVRRNVILNNFESRVTVHEVALGSQADTVYLNESGPDDTTNHVSDHGTPVTQVTLDSLTTELTKIDFLKIDVEGYEYHVLKGATATLAKTKQIYIEFIPELLARGGAEPEDVLTLLGAYFDLFTLSPTLERRPFTYDATSTVHADLLGVNRAYANNH